jgi:hypothetical protein
MAVGLYCTHAEVMLVGARYAVTPYRSTVALAFR